MPSKFVIFSIISLSTCSVFAQGPLYLKARYPYPLNGSVDCPHDVDLTWAPGMYANTHDVYFGTSSTDVQNASRSNSLGVLVSQDQDASSYDPGLLEIEQTYYWRVDEVNAPINPGIYKGDVWSFIVEPLFVKACRPSPANGTTAIPQEMNLSWRSGFYAETHDVYLGTSLTDVQNADRSTPLGVLVSYGQTGVTYNPGSLESGQTYFWRIDEVNSFPDYTIYEGDIWSFTIFADQYNLTISSTSGGSVTTPGEGIYSYDYNASVPVTATANSGYHFVSWTGTAVDAGKVTNPNSASTTVRIGAKNYTLAANFAINRHTLTTSSTSGGAVTSPGEGIFEYDYGTQVNLIATPEDANHVFVNWSGEMADPNSASTSVTVTQDMEITANFEAITYTLEITTSIGGSVVEPNEGIHEYTQGSIIDINAIAEPNFVFKNWTGTAVDAGKIDNPKTSTTFMIIDANYTVKANFETTESTLHVGTDDPNDPNDDDLIGNLQDAIDVVPDDNEVTIIINEGTYTGNLTLRDNIKLQVSEPNDPNDPNDDNRPTIIGNDPNASAISIIGDPNSSYTIEDFIIKGGLDGITCDEGTPIIKNCIITGSKGYGITLYDTNNASIINCTITGNGSDPVDSGGITTWGSNNVTIVNTILWNNFPYNVKTWSGEEPNISYSSVGVDPLFAFDGYWADVNDPNIIVEPNDPNARWIDGDYHLMSKEGRWDAALSTWVQDLLTSSRIDAGSPTYPINKEPEPNGDIINIGAYGGTLQASKSYYGSNE